MIILAVCENNDIRAYQVDHADEREGNLFFADFLPSANPANEEDAEWDRCVMMLANYKAVTLRTDSGDEIKRWNKGVAVC
jgi:hypothetical protein